MAADGRIRWMVGLGVVAVAEIALYRAWPLLDDSDPPPALEDQLAVAAAVLLLGLPHVIAWLGRRRRWLLQVAGTLGVALTVVSVLGFSLIFFTIPLLGIPSILYLVRGASVPERAPGGLTVAMLALAIAATAAFFLTEDPRCSITVRRDGKLVRSTPPTCDVSGNTSSSGTLGPEVVEWSGTSDTIAWHESLLSLGLSVIAIALCVRSEPAIRESGGAAVLLP